MSNKTQLATNNTQLASLIQTLQGKAAGGGGASVETCTVEITISAWNSYGFTVYENGGFGTKTVISGNYSGNITVENVVCGSLFHVYPSFGAPEATITGGATLIGTYHTMNFKATETANETTKINIYSNL